MLATTSDAAETPGISSFFNFFAHQNAARSLDQGLENSHLLPFTTYRVYEETRAALSNDQPVLAGIGIRAIVETICKEQNAAGKDLKAKIDDLATKGVITSDGAKILHSLRFMGNNAAHEVKSHTSDELITALDVAEYLLKGVYILPKLAEKLPKK